jgi:hypothetical protein
VELIHGVAAMCFVSAVVFVLECCVHGVFCAQAIPLCLAAPIAGVLLDLFNQRDGESGSGNGTRGYTVLFLLAAGYLFLGIVGVSKLKKVK